MPPSRGGDSTLILNLKTKHDGTLSLGKCYIAHGSGSGYKRHLDGGVRVGVEKVV